MSSPQPTVGRIVHYHPWAAERAKHRVGVDAPVAAMVTAVGESNTGFVVVTLRAFYPSGAEAVIFDVYHADEPTAGRWTWPPRV